MANKLVKIHENDFEDKGHFIKVQCQAYLLAWADKLVLVEFSKLI